MPALPRRLVFFISLTASLGATAGFVLVLKGPLSVTSNEALIAVALCIMLAVAIRFPLQLSPQMQHDMGAAPVVAAIILLPPPLAFLICALGALAGEMTKTTRRPAQVTFNVSVFALAVGAASAWKSFGFVGNAVDHVLEVLLVACTYYAVSATFTEGIVSLQLRRRPFRAWWKHNSEPFVHEVSLLVIGGLTAMVVQASPSALPLMAVPCLVIFRSLRFQQGRLRRAEAGRALAEEERARLTTIIEATPDFVATADGDGRILYLNEGGRSMLGLSLAGDIDGLNLGAIIDQWDEHAAAAVAHGNWSGESHIGASAAAGVIPLSQVILAHRAADGHVEFLSTVARDISERKRMESQLVHIAGHDALTGLLNRRRFDDELDRQLARARRGGQGGALLFIDLDRFKVVNDRFGHEAGDRLLAELAAEITSHVIRRGDILARLGGDEFAVILPWASRDSAETVARRLIDVVSGHRLAVNGQEAGVGASVGIALFPQHGATPREVMARADAAMYHAKESHSGLSVAGPIAA